MGRLGAVPDRLGAAGPAAPDAARPKQGVYVPAGEDRFKAKAKIWAVISLEIKIAIADTNGAMFAFEHAGIGKGGPPRHLHLA